jgi:hypothetical protein
MSGACLEYFRMAADIRLISPENDAACHKENTSLDGGTLPAWSKRW